MRYHIKKSAVDGKITRLVTRKYGVFNVNETRVILVDDMYVPTKMFPIWGSKEGVVGTVSGFTDDFEKVHVTWDNGFRNTFSLKYLKQYDKKRHGKPMSEVKPGPNTSFKIQKTYGDYGG